MYIQISLLLLLLAETITRIRFRQQHGVPYLPKRIGEYPYKKFIEDCDAPLYWRLRAGYADKQIHINSLGLRCPELQEGRRRIWVVGESDQFGVKLPSEKQIWFKTFQKKLDEAGYDFQVMNASVIGYNGEQTAAFVTTLPIAKDDILLLRPNQNDVSIAYINGKEWQPGSPWPLAFIHKLQSHTPWFSKLLNYSCIGMKLRRLCTKKDIRASFFTPKPGFQWERLLDHQQEQLQRMITYGQQRGAQIAFFNFSPSYSPKCSPAEEAALASIQANWRHFVEGWSQYQFGINEEAATRLAQPLGLPVLDIRPYIWEHPKRYQLFFDLMHYNGSGHKVFAEALFEELQHSNLLKQKNP